MKIIKDHRYLGIGWISVYTKPLAAPVGSRIYEEDTGDTWEFTYNGIWEKVYDDNNKE